MLIKRSGASNIVHKGVGPLTGMTVKMAGTRYTSVPVFDGKAKQQPLNLSDQEQAEIHWLLQRKLKQ